MSINFEQMKIEERKKNTIVAYLLWWFLGLFGAHRFYMGKSLAFVMLGVSLMSFITLVIFVGYVGLLVMFVWWIIDGISLHKWVMAYNIALIEEYERKSAL